MNRTLPVVAFFFMCVPLLAKEPPSRPHIFGITRVQIFAKDLHASRDFYVKVLNHAHDCNWCEDEPDPGLRVNIAQAIVLSAAPSRKPSNRIGEIAFVTDDLALLRRYFTHHKLIVSKPNKPTDNYLMVLDPEGHHIAFVERSAKLEKLLSTHASVMRLFHVGFTVHGREAEDRFYEDILGFKVCPSDGVSDDEANLVDLQVPDGTDRLEYILGVPPNSDPHAPGAVDRIALSIENLKSAAEQLWDDRVLPILQEPKIGRDGKLRLDLYDPDGTRVELRELVPEQKADNRGPHPGQKP
jgi:catechol 2,3-dioxygenase-like lactoylglutathione lyase family enzyme